MDEELADLIARLTVQAGMLMEYRCPELVMRLPVDRLVVEARVDRMERMGRDLVALAAASRVLLRLVADDLSCT